MKIKVLILTFMMFSLVACSDSEEALKEQTTIQVKKEISEQNQNEQEWAKELLKDFIERQSFIKAMSGSYEGKFNNGEDLELNSRITITSSLPLYIPNRRVTKNEIENHLQDLALNINVVQWNLKSFVSSGCSFEKITPDYENGRIELISNECDYSYSLDIASINKKNETDIFTIKSKNKNASLIKAIRDSSTVPNVNIFKLKKVQNIREIKVSEFFVDENEYAKIKKTKDEYEFLSSLYHESKGTYVGDFKISNEDFSVRMSFSLKSPYQLVNRFYSYEEITGLIDDISFSTQAVVWNKKRPLTAVSCIFDAVKIDTTTNILTLISETCSNLFTVDFSDLENIVTEVLPARSSRSYITTLDKEQ